MWTEVLLTASAAALAGTAIVPATRHLLLGDVEHDWLAGELEFDRIDNDGMTVHLKDGAFFRVYQVRGVAYDAKVLAEQEVMLKGRSALIHGLGEKGCAVRLFGVKRLSDISFEANWPSPALVEIGAAERREFTSCYRVGWYMVISARSMKALLEGCGKITAMMGSYRPQPLRRPENETAPCPLTGFLNYLVCGDLRSDLPAVSESISANLPASSLDFDKESGLVKTMVPTEKLHRIIAVRSWPETVSGTLMAEVLTLKGDIEVAQTCEPWDRDQAIMIYKRRANEQRAAFVGNETLAKECEAIVELLSQGDMTLFSTQYQITLRADTEAALNEVVTAVCQVLGHRRVIYNIETVGAGLCWFNRMPTAVRRKIAGSTTLLRPLTLRDQNIAALWPFQHSPTGLMSSPYGDKPVRFFRTPTGQAYAFQFHVMDKPQSIGNYLLFGPTGGGKSILMMHLLGGLAKFPGVRSYIFDSKEGARFMVEVLGGVYQGYEDLKLNPLDVGSDTPANRHRVYSVLKAMSAGAEPGEDDEEVLAHAVELAFTMDVPERTLNAIFEHAFARRSPLRRAFAPWVIDGKGHRGMKHHVFNAPHDSLGSFLNAAHMVGINMNEALDDPLTGPAVVAHISGAISKSAASAAKGFTIFIDEAAKLLQNDGFKALAMEMYREYRKLNGTVGLAFQDPAALFRSGVAEAFLENTASLLFLPNSQASKASLEPFNLNEEQIAFILGGGAEEGKRQVLIVKRDAASGSDESAIIDVDLDPLDGRVRERFYRAGTDANKDLAAIKSKWGDQWLSNI